MTSARRTETQRGVRIPAGSAVLEGDLCVPESAVGIILFAHGSGSSRHSPRNRYVARVLQRSGLATLLMDLLTSEEETADAQSGHIRFDIDLLGDRLGGATEWLARDLETANMRVGYFGASTGAAAALVAAAQHGSIGAVVSRGGRPDLAGAALPGVSAPTLLIVGGRDTPVIAMNEQALAELRCEKRLAIVPDATHLFEEPGTLEEAAGLARDWFAEHLAPTAEPARIVSGTSAENRPHV